MDARHHPLSWQDDRVGPCVPGGCEALLRELLRLGYLRSQLAREERVTLGRLAEIVRRAPDWSGPAPPARRPRH